MEGRRDGDWQEERRSQKRGGKEGGGKDWWEGSGKQSILLRETFSRGF